MNKEMVTAYWLWNAPVRENLSSKTKWSGQRVLDVGAGEGLLAAYLRRRGADVVTVDILAPSKPSPLHAVASSTALPFADRTFDAVVSCSTLQYVDQRCMIAEAMRVLRPGGRLLLNENGADSPIAILARIFLRTRAAIDPRTRRYLATIRSHLRPSDLNLWGFKVVSWDGHYLFGPMHALVAAIFGERSRLSRQLIALDHLILRTIPALRRFCWFHTIQLEAGCQRPE